ncbi:MAG: ABC transporter permease [Actinobacteria bacterium]|nr:ABC transporter permease [Actinomycetota bacterium]
MTPLVKLELRGLWRTGRVAAVAAVMLLFGIAGPAFTKFLPQILEGQLPEGMRVTIPPATAELAFLTFLQNISQLGFVVLVLVTMGAVAAERRSGLTAMLFVKPVSTLHYLIAKLLTMGALVVVSVLVAGVVAWGYAVLLFGPLSFGAGLAATGLYALWGLAIVSWTLFLSSVVRSQLLAGVGAIGLMFAFPIVEAVTGRAGDFTPFAVLAHGDALLSGRFDAALAVAADGSVALVVLGVVGAWQALRRAEFA